MKKTIYTIAFIALFSVVSNAQTTSKPAPAKAETVNPDGTISPAPAALTPAASETVPKDDKGSKSEKKESGTRMAITEKGVPASKKPAETKKAEPAKTEKH